MGHIAPIDPLEKKSSGRNSKAWLAAKIVALCIGASVIYGIVHDQITARVYLPYFTEWHPHVIDSNDPTLVALVWGVIATWWVGLIISIPLSFAALSGREPPAPFREVRNAIWLLLCIMFVVAAGAGTGAYLLNFQAPDVMAGRIETDLTTEGVRRFTAVWVAHNTSYLTGFVGGIGLCFLTLATRRRRYMEAENSIADSGSTEK